MAKQRALRLLRPGSLVDFATCIDCVRLLPQAHACAELINQWSFSFPGAARLLNQAGFYLYKRGRYADAEPLYQRALAIREKALGPEHPDVAQSLKANTRRRSRFTNGRWPSGKRGPEHPDVATSLENYARFLRDIGQSEKALLLESRAITIRAKRAPKEVTTT
jgi:tetratricopeptide (TPR) repeat protein